MWFIKDKKEANWVEGIHIDCRKMNKRQNRKLVVKAVVIVFFIVLLVLPAIIQRDSVSSTAETAGSGSSLKFFGFHLQEIADPAGLHFQHESAILDPRLNHIHPQIASMGASVSVSDFDRDGWNDLYVTTSRQGRDNVLYHNLKDGTFRDVTSEAGLSGLNNDEKGVSMGSVWGDFDNDGFEDLFVYKWGKPELFHNLGGMTFKNISDQSGLPDWINANTALWMDYNRDGLLDLFIGGYYREDLVLWQLESTVIMPESFEYSNNGGRNYLFKNLGNGVFEDVTEQAGLTSTRWTLAAGSADLNGDGFQDLVIANDYGVDEMYINNGGIHFTETGREAGIGYAPKSGMNITFGDIENKGSQCLYISNITEVGVLLQGNNLWVPADPGTDALTYKNMARQKGVELGGWSYGAQFGDLNNDGALDLYVANGFISGIRGSSYWYDYSKVTGGNKAIISDAANWPAMEGKSQSGYQQNVIWLNDGNGNFLDVSLDVCGEATMDSRSVVMADLWNRGVLDIVVANMNNKLLVYRNEVDPANHWIGFALEGTSSNRSAIGALLTLYWDGKKQSQVVTGGIGFCSQNQRTIHFGIGKNNRIEKAVIIWPSGTRQVIEGPDINQVHQVRESTESL